MDGYEASRMVFSRIQSLDPENASKIMGLLLLQDHGEKEMIRLAFGPETLVHSVIVKTKKELGLMNCARPHWSGLPGQDELISPKNGSSTLNPASMPFYANGRSSVDVSDDFELQERLSLLDDVSPRPDFAGSVHGRSGRCVSDGLGYEGSDLGFGWGPCPYSARGFCKNGSNCRFVHGGDHQYGGVDGGAALVGSPSRIEVMDTCNELLRSKAVPIPHPPRLGHQFMGSSCFPFSPKSVNLQQTEAQRGGALLMGDDLQKLGRYRAERNELWSMASPAARQIYLTFPADSTFKEEDVSNYFSTYGPVQDVRIPYQQKRMFGFVTFVYPETVKSILGKGNPHFVCDSRVLVKPYKEKGKVPDKYRYYCCDCLPIKSMCSKVDSLWSTTLNPLCRTKQTTERELSSPCGTPTALDPRDAMDLQLGARTVYNNTPDLLWRRKFEEHALELQSRRLMSLQLLDVKKHFHHSSPTVVNSPNPFSQTLFSPPPDNSLSPFSMISITGSAENKKKITELVTQRESVGDKEKGSTQEGSDDNKINLPESLEDSLPNSPFASPTHHFLLFDDSVAAADNNVSGSSSPSSDNDDSTSTLSDSFKSFNCQMPRLSSIGMLGGSSGPICRVGI